MLNKKEINKLREELDESILENKDYSIIYSISVKLYNKILGASNRMYSCFYSSTYLSKLSLVGCAKNWTHLAGIQ